MPDTDSAQFPGIYRAIMKRAWYDAASQRVISAAFVLRGQDTGLSVLKARWVLAAGLSCWAKQVFRRVCSRNRPRCGLGFADC